MSNETHSAGDSGEGDKVLVAEYVLGLLSTAEHENLAARLAAEPTLRAEFQLWQQRLAALDREFAEVTAPAATLNRVETRLFGRTQVGGLSGFWNSLALWRGLAAAGVAVAAIAIGINLTTPKIDPKLFASQLVAALQAEGSNVSFVALYDPTTASVRLTALSGEQPADNDYELWAIEGSNAPISMGVVPINAKVEVKIPASALSGWGEGTILAVTLERKGGSPTGSPQGPIVAKGTATAI